MTKSKRLAWILAAALLVVMTLSMTVAAEEVAETTAAAVVEQSESSASLESIRGQLYEAVWSFWSIWFPADVVTSFPDVFVLLSVGSTLIILIAFLRLVGSAFGLIKRRK